MSLKLRPMKERDPEDKKQKKKPKKLYTDMVGFVLGVLALDSYTSLGWIARVALTAFAWWMWAVSPENRRSYLLHVFYGLFCGALFWIFIKLS